MAWSGVDKLMGVCANGASAPRTTHEFCAERVSPIWSPSRGPYIPVWPKEKEVFRSQ